MIPPILADIWSDATSVGKSVCRSSQYHTMVSLYAGQSEQEKRMCMMPLCVALFPGLPPSFYFLQFAVSIIHRSGRLPCIALNANQRANKVGGLGVMRSWTFSESFPHSHSQARKSLYVVYRYETE